MLIFLEFFNEKGESVVLTICDFAGVENRFACDNLTVLKKFEDITDRSGKEKFYEKQLNEKMSALTGGLTSAEIMSKPGIKISEADKKILLGSREQIALTRKAMEIIQKVWDNRTKPGDKDISFVNIDISKKIIAFDQDDIINNKAIKIVQTILNQKLSPSSYSDFNKAMISIFNPIVITTKAPSGSETTIPSRKKETSTKVAPKKYIMFKVDVKSKQNDKAGVKAQTTKKEIIEVAKEDKPETTSLYENFKNEIIKNEIVFLKQSGSKDICIDRVKEGLFINDSLEKLRYVISDFITNIMNKDKAISYPPFEDMCLPIQCNPYFEDCFGSSTKPLSNPVSVIMKEIKRKICGNPDADEKCESYRNLNIVIFNVLNISKKANNPPPIPYTDISGLIIELNRLETVSKRLYNLETTMDEISPVITNEYVREEFLDDIENRETIKFYDSVVQDEINMLIKELRDRGIGIVQQIVKLKDLINYINRINAVTSIGTMEFTDMVAKFGINRSICNYMIMDEPDFDKFLAKTPELLKDELLSRMNQQRSAILEKFDSLFVKNYTD